MPFVVRTWNLFHGRTHPPARRTHLRHMVELVTEDAPDVVALQEVPVWAIGRLERWSGMTARWAVTVPSLLLGPLARLVTEIDAARLRSLFTGQANVVLVAPRLTAGEQRLLQLNDAGRWEWLRLGRQQRWCQAVGVESFVVANLHATNEPRVAAEEAARAAAFVSGEERVVLCGDFNVPAHAVEGFSPPIAGIDQILVRGLELVEPARAWEPGRRVLGGRLLSDHAPVEAVVG